MPVDVCGVHAPSDTAHLHPCCPHALLCSLLPACLPTYCRYDVSSNEVDFCVTLGGDGTVLHLASLFEKDEPLPPVISFAMGSLGFLTPFDAK